MYKLLDTILNMKLQTELREDGYYKLNNNQAGFRAGLGCELNILRITELIRKNMEVRKNRKLWTLFIDLKSAFDTVDHKILMEKMKTLQISK